MEETQVTTDLTASQVLARDVQELSQIMGDALAPLTQMTPVELSQNVAACERAQEAVACMKIVLEHVNSMLEKAGALNNIKKTVHFQRNSVRARIQAFKNGVADIDENGCVTAEAILNCDYLYVGDVDATYDSSRVTVCNDVHIVLASDNLKMPSRLVFWSGGTYHLYYGNSLSMCNHLSRTTTLGVK